MDIYYYFERSLLCLPRLYLFDGKSKKKKRKRKKEKATMLHIITL